MATLTLRLTDIPPISDRKPGPVTCTANGVPYPAHILAIAGTYILIVQIDGLRPLPNQHVAYAPDTALVDRFIALGNHAVKTYTVAL